ncbi:MAG TPA: branched-chain amino acid ABC transporter permease [Candidatus Limnocylindrales bacterium]|nr:branched-chain amino acid ABC transporter permease [Candidatus Limnocylindrales bacterium]
MTLWDILLQQLFNGLLIGAFYGLVAVGYSMVYGVIKLLNFAHADIYMCGAFCGLILLTFFAPNIGNTWFGIVVALLISMLVVGILGVVIQRVAYQPMLKAPRLSILITALAVSMLLYNAVLLMTQGQVRAFRTGIVDESFFVGSLRMTDTRMVLLISALLLMLILHLFITRTMYGKAMRAIALDHDTCRLMGINVHKIIALTFFVGSALAAAAGIMAGVHYGTVHFFMGFLIGLKAFTAAVIGGIGIIPGAMLGGLFLGLLEAFATQIPFIGTAWKDVFSFAFLILFLIFKPHGILGRRVSERM